MKLREIVRKLLQAKGYALVRQPTRQFFQDNNFDVVIDVGGNVGQFGRVLRHELGYEKKIVSFEPMAKAFEKLNSCAKDDPNWTAWNCALGNSNGSNTINVAGNSASSSLYDMLPRHSDAAPYSAMVGHEAIDVKKLDDVFDEITQPSDKILLKIDTQGYEAEVLAGATESLKHVAALQLELSLSPLYEGAPLLEDLIAQARRHGFAPYWFLHGFRNPETLQLLQIDGLFVRQTEDDHDWHARSFDKSVYPNTTAGAVLEPRA